MKDLVSRGTPVHRFFKSCSSKVFSCELSFPMCTFSHAFVSRYQNTPFPSSSLPVPAAVEQIQHLTVEEGRNVTKECNVTAGTPPLNVSWKNLKTGLVIKGKLLTIINIRRNQSGEYRCIANNTCGNESTGMFIDVHCKNLYNVFIRLDNVCHLMLVSVLYNSVLSRTAIFQCFVFPDIVL